MVKVAIPAPDSVPAPSTTAPSLKVTVPVGVPPLLDAVAVKVTAWPTWLGFCDEVNVVDVALRPTAIGPDVPVMEDVTVSVAVMVREPAVLSVAENVPTPLLSAEVAGSAAAPSLLVKFAVPT